VPSTTNFEEKEIVDAPENNGNASMTEKVQRNKPWKKKKKKVMMMMMMMMMCRDSILTDCRAKTCKITQHRHEQTKQDSLNT
jgi:hypothetical protein